MVVDITGADHNWFVTGIVSFGVGCGVDGIHTVYTRVTSYSQQIMGKIKPKKVTVFNFKEIVLSSSVLNRPIAHVRIK